MTRPKSLLRSFKELLGVALHNQHPNQVPIDEVRYCLQRVLLAGLDSVPCAIVTNAP